MGDIGQTVSVEIRGGGIALLLAGYAVFHFKLLQFHRVMRTCTGLLWIWLGVCKKKNTAQSLMSKSTSLTANVVLTVLL